MVERERPRRAGRHRRGCWHSAVLNRLEAGQWLLASLAVAFVALALGYALATPPWNNPDEPAHFNYVRHLVETATLPELRPGDWDAAQLEALKAARFPPGEPIDAIRYESHQPPLYYLLASPVLALGQLAGQESGVLALRGLSILFGLLLVLTTYRVAGAALGMSKAGADHPVEWYGAADQRLFPPPASATALLAAALAAFVPMSTAMSAAINNDGLASFLAAWLLLVLLRALAGGLDDQRALFIGLLGGLLLLTKLTVYGLVPIALLVVALAPARSGAPRWRAGARRLALATGAMVLVAGWWFVRQGVVYGWDDLLASRRHEVVVAGQPRWSDLAVEPAPYFLATLFRSFWAQFGWMGIVVDERLYRLFGLFSALSIYGLAVWLRQTGRRRLIELASPRSSAMAAAAYAPLGSDRLMLLLATIVVVSAEVVFYNLTFVQPQGRYLFPALAALAVVAAVGWDSLFAESRLGRGLAMAWLVAALLESASLLLGLELSARVVYGVAGSTGLALGLGTPTGPTWPWLRASLTLGAALALGLLNLVCLLTAVVPAFNAS